MRHEYLEPGSLSGEHYGVSHNDVDKVLVQLGDKEGNQIRVALTIQHAEFMMYLLEEAIEHLNRFKE
jgi:hypothetical protein